MAAMQITQLFNKSMWNEFMNFQKDNSVIMLQSVSSLSNSELKYSSRNEVQSYQILNIHSCTDYRLSEEK